MDLTLTTLSRHNNVEISPVNGDFFGSDKLLHKFRKEREREKVENRDGPSGKSFEKETSNQV